MSDYIFFMKAFTSLLAILNPVGALPVYISIKSMIGRKESKTVFTASLSVAVILFVFMLLGESILSFFGITLPAFRIGGGLMILSIAFSMLQGQMSPAKHTPEESEGLPDVHSIAVVPLAIPIMAGPGSISTVILLGQKMHGPTAFALLCAAIFLNALVIYVLFSFAETVNKLLGVVGVKIFTRIMGMILVAIAVQFVTDGLGELFPILKTAL